MTSQQKLLLDYLRRFPGDGVQPSITEMAEFMRLKGRGGVHRMLQLLQQEGLVEKIDAGTRCWRAKPIDPFAGIEDGAMLAELERRGHRSRQEAALRHARTFIENRFSDLSPEKRSTVAHIDAALEGREFP